MILDAVGGGLIAGGAVILLVTFLGNAPGETFGEAEQDRRERNAWIASRAAAVATGAGAVLLLVPSQHWPYALGVAFGAVVACYLLLAHATRAEYVRLRDHVRSQAANRLPVSVYIAIGLGLQADDPRVDAATLVKLWSPVAMPVVQAEAERRASWRWALTHPTGARAVSQKQGRATTPRPLVSNDQRPGTASAMGPFPVQTATSMNPRSAVVRTFPVVACPLT